MADTATKPDTPQVDEAVRLLDDFAVRSGLAPATAAPVRYLWTDALAVCAWLGLYGRTGEARFLSLAEALIAQVHAVLGKHRDDDPRTGWLSGLDERAGNAHPTTGGLRIGKERPEREPGAPYDESAEWHRDGQYLHYLTKWMHALSRAHAATGTAAYRAWAEELAIVAHRRFVIRDARTGAPRYAWKMRIDLSGPQVAASGLHDALDMYVTCHEIRAQQRAAGTQETAAALERERRAAARMLTQRSWASADPLGIGGLLFDAARIAAMIDAGMMPDDGLDARLLHDAALGLGEFVATGALRAPAAQRLAFRELGLSAGLHALTLIRARSQRADGVLGPSLQRLTRYFPLAAQIEAFWCVSAHRRVASWREHENINAVALATSLVPEQYLAA